MAFLQRPPRIDVLVILLPSGGVRTLFALALLAVLFAAGVHSETPVDSALKAFLGTDARGFALNLENSRPLAITAALRVQILNSLPAKGEITNLKRLAQSKLTSLDEILRAHHRESVYEVKVLGIPEVFIGLHARAVLLISDPALRLLDKEELQAVVAHEIGHEYVWAQYQRARELHDHRILQELELYCDGVAIVTLMRLGKNPLRLIAALEKMYRVDPQGVGTDAWDRYPSFEERTRFARKLIAWAAPAKLAEPRAGDDRK